jgi:hypothetical protein
MLTYKITLSGLGGELDSVVVHVNADDQDGLRLQLISWLETERAILAAGDTITIEAKWGG